MADDLQVTAAIEVKGTLAVGDNPQPSNEFKLIIKNQGKAITPPEGGRILFYFTGNLGSAESALFLNETDARTSDRKSTRLNSSHANISYAVFCLKKKTRPTHTRNQR